MSSNLLSVKHVLLSSTYWLMFTSFGAMGQNAAPVAIPANALYEQRGLPIERRLDDLVGRMTLEEKVRQLVYSGATALVDKHSDNTHAAREGVFVAEGRKRFSAILASVAFTI